MGAERFMEIEAGKGLDEAFKKAVKKARYLYGHAGYTGTIAEKKDVINVRTPYVRAGTRRQTYVNAVRMAIEYADMGYTRPTRELSATQFQRKENKRLKERGFDMDLLIEETLQTEKWGPACGMQLGRSNQYLFWGWASS